MCGTLIFPEWKYTANTLYKYKNKYTNFSGWMMNYTGCSFCFSSPWALPVPETVSQHLSRAFQCCKETTQPSQLSELILPASPVAEYNAKSEFPYSSTGASGLPLLHLLMLLLLQCCWPNYFCIKFFFFFFKLFFSYITFFFPLTVIFSLTWRISNLKG